jgi:sugar phosphate isomerase/epimerase
MESRAAMLRFGIMANQLGLILERFEGAGAAPSPAALASIAGDYDIVGHVRSLANAGFNTIELNTDLELFLPGCYRAEAVEGLRVLASERGLSYTAHLPLWSIDLATPEGRVRAASVEAVAEAILRLAPLEPEVYVVHATGELAFEFSRMQLPPSARSLVLEGFQIQAKRSMEAILRETGLPSRLLAVENLGFPLEYTTSLAEEFDTSLCLDTGHVLAGYSGELSLPAALERMLPRLAEIHLHDGYRAPDGRAGDHLRLGEGQLDVAWFLECLERSGFVGPLIFEVSVPDALASLRAIDAARRQ